MKNKFEKKILKNQDIIVGGKETEPDELGSGEETSSCRGTTYDVIIASTADIEKTGDWISTCKSTPATRNNHS